MRILFKLIIFIVILVIAGLIALPFIVDPNDYKQEISSQVEKATGRTLTLDGDTIPKLIKISKLDHKAKKYNL